MMYNMCITWDTECDFVFESWRSTSAGGLIFGIILSFLAAFFSVWFSFVKQNYLNRNKLQITIGFVINYLIKLIIMFLIMTMNGFVNIAIIFGMTFGQLGYMHLSKVRKWNKVSKDSAVSQQ